MVAQHAQLLRSDRPRVDRFAKYKRVCRYLSGETSHNRTSGSFRRMHTTSGAFTRQLNSQLNLDGAHATEKLRRN